MVFKFDPYKALVQYRGEMNPYDPINGRKYTLTHSDITAQLFLYVGDSYAEDAIDAMRDEVRLQWQQTQAGPVLVGSVYVGNSAIRREIFMEEMPLALQAVRHADRFLFEEHPELDESFVYIHFESPNPEYDATYDWGTIGEYKTA